MNRNWTEILNLAGQMHNLHQDPYMPLDEEYENEMARKILELLGVPYEELLENLDGIADELYDDARSNETRFECVERFYNNLERIITNAFGEPKVE